MKDHAVVIAGAGPTGLMLAGELALAHIDVAIVERRASQDLIGLRAGGLHMRTLEVFDQRGIAERFIAQGQIHRAAPFARMTLDIGDTPTRHNYFLALWQTHIERILADWVSELAVPIYRGCELAELAQDDGGVVLTLADGRSLRAQYIVGCDGGRSAVRKKAGIDFPGWDATVSYLIAEVDTADEPAWGVRRVGKGMSAIAKLEDGKRARMVLSERDILVGEKPSLSDVREALIAVYGTDFGLRSAEYISRFSDMTRQAASYRRGRVFLAGDAAHVHSPMGGQGLNLGVQDAVNLGWKLAQVVHRSSPESLLDSYHAERHPVGARVLRNTMALTALERSDDRNDALRELVSELMRVDAARRQYVAMTSGLDIRYELGEGHPLLGRRMPDLDVVTEGGKQRVFMLLHEARPVLLDLGQGGAPELAPWADRVRSVAARYEGEWELPALGVVSAPSAVLIRPDGYVAWVGEGTLRGLREALSVWFGVLCVVLALCAGCNHPSSPRAHADAATQGVAFRRPAAERVVAIGDLHGDVAATRAALRLAGALGRDDHWAGGKLVVVQTGDQLDRGDDEPDILDLLERLSKEASAAGGALHVLNGNHEVMNVEGDFRYVTPDGFHDYAASRASAHPDVVQSVPAEQRGRAAAFLPGEATAKRLAKRPSILQVGDNVFVHGGLLEKHVQYGIDRINREIQAWMSTPRRERAPSIAVSPDGPLWLRIYSAGTPLAGACDELGKVLRLLSAKRLVVGHTVQEQGINSACEGRVWRIDVGLSRFYGSPPSVLELRGDKARAIVGPAGPR